VQGDGGWGAQQLLAKDEMGQGAAATNKNQSELQDTMF